MDAINDTLALWALIVALIVIATVSLGMRGARPGASRQGTEPAGPASPCEVLIPVAGTFPDQESLLGSFLAQSHPDYRVLFIVESENDPANAVIDKLCRCCGNARKVLSGPGSSCGQKNHNLIAGLRHLRPETEIIVFCDAGNTADPGWLLRFTRPLDSDPDRVLTTFRDFHPMPPTLGGLCQAVYGAFLLVMPRIRPSPWGGGTAMHRRTLERLRVTEAWSQTVVDDVVLGRLLHEKGVPMTMDRANRLDSPLRSQTMGGFLAYLERQVLFPKFADPALWLVAMAFHLILTLTTMWAMVCALWLFPLQVVGAGAGWSAWGFLVCEIAVAFALRSANQHRIPAGKWLLAVYLCIFLGAFVFLRSIFQREIVWQGRRYVVGPNGVVISATRLP